MLSTSPSFWMSEANISLSLFCLCFCLVASNALQFAPDCSARKMEWMLHCRCKCILEVCDDDHDGRRITDGQLGYGRSAYLTTPSWNVRAPQCEFLFLCARFAHSMIVLMMMTAGWWKSSGMEAIRRLFFVIIHYSLDSDEHYETVCFSLFLSSLSFEACVISRIGEASFWSLQAHRCDDHQHYWPISTGSSANCEKYFLWDF